MRVMVIESQYGPFRLDQGQRWPLDVLILLPRQQIQCVSGQQTAEVIQKKISVPLCDYRCKTKEIHQLVIAIGAENASDKHK
jgi:hypothetical protein